MAILLNADDIFPKFGFQCCEAVEKTDTLVIHQIEPYQKGPFPILHSSIARNSLELKTNRIFQIQRGILDLIQFIQFIHLKKHLDGAWDTFGKKSLNGTFTVHQKKTFGPKKF